MKKTFIFISLLAAALVSCNKENQIVTDTQVGLVPMTFSASLPSTRTVLDGVKVLWAVDDVLNVIEVNAGGELVGEHPFTLSSGEGTVSATFSGEVESTDNTFYAVYPNVKLYNSPATVGETLELKNLGQDVRAVENGYDPKMAVMTAVVDENGELAFRHAMAYIKFTVNSDNLASVKVTAGGGARIYGRPIITIENGAPKAVNGTGSNSNLTMSGVFVKGSSYYFPITIKPDNKLGELTFLATTTSGMESTVSTTSLSNLVPTAGKVYNLGQIPFSFAPSISVTEPDKLEYDATSGSFAYSIFNAPEGAAATAVITSGTWISNLTVSGNTVSFDCEKNDAADAGERTATIKLSYTGAEDVVVTITQNGKVASKESHLWDFAEFTDEQMKSITGLDADAKATAGQTWNFGDGLTMVTNGSSKWNNQTINGTAYKWVATGGKYGSSQKFFSFTTNSVGTVTVLYAAGGSSSRALTLNANGTEKTDSDHVSAGTSDLKTVTFASVPKGTIMLYSKDDNIRVYSISFMED